MSFFKREKESPGALESKYAKLEKERERLQLRSEVRAREKEIKRLSHPHQEESIGIAKGTGGRISRFTAKIIKKEVIPSAKKTNNTFKTTGRSLIRVKREQPGRRSFMAPTGQDSSLSGAIARNDWHGEGRNLMDREFFGSTQVPQEKQDILGPRLDRELVSSNDSEKKNKVRYY